TSEIKRRVGIRGGQWDAVTRESIELLLGEILVAAFGLHPQSHWTAALSASQVGPRLRPIVMPSSSEIPRSLSYIVSLWRKQAARETSDLSHTDPKSEPVEFFTGAVLNAVTGDDQHIAELVDLIMSIPEIWTVADKCLSAHLLRRRIARLGI